MIYLDQSLDYENSIATYSGITLSPYSHYLTAVLDSVLLP